MNRPARCCRKLSPNFVGELKIVLDGLLKICQCVQVEMEDEAPDDDGPHLLERTAG